MFFFATALDWDSETSEAVWIAMYIVVIAIINMLGVRVYGEVSHLRLTTLQTAYCPSLGRVLACINQSHHRDRLDHTQPRHCAGRRSDS